MATGRRRGDEDERLFRACEGKEFDRATQLLKDGANPRKHFDSKSIATILQKPTQCTSLHAVCLHGSLELAKLLVESYGCDPEVDTTGHHDRIRPLHLASVGGHLDVVRYLVVERGCDAECIDWRWRIPLHWACGGGRDYISRNMLASEERALEVVKFFTISANCDPNKRDIYQCHNALLWSCHGGLTSVTRFLVSELHCSAAVHDIDGNTPVHLASQSNALETLKFLITAARCDPNVKNNDGLTPLQVTSDPATIRELIKNGASTAHMYKKYGHILGHSSKKPLPNTVKVLIVGDPSSGKSTLTESLKDESILNRLVNIKSSGVSENTAGVIPHQIKSKKLGHVSLLDFAGQREFYNSHGALLQNAIQSSAPIFVIVADLSMSDEEITDNIRYWLCFIENHSSSKPHVIITGSHIDLLKSKREDPDIKTKRISSSLQQSLHSSSFTLAGFVAMDCRYPDSRGMRELRQRLQKSCDELRLVEESSFASHYALVHLLDAFQESTACTVHQGIKALDIREELLVKSCEELNERGHILFLKNRAAPEKSWIILNQAVLLSEVSGTIFAPVGFKEHCQLASSTGVVPLSKITGKFPKYNPEMLIGFLSHLEYCHEISDDEITQLLSEATTAASENEPTSSPQQERYFYFPGLVTVHAPAKVWEPQAQFVHYCGWVLQCSRPEHFFVPRFFCVLLRLAFSFALTPQAVELTSDHPALERKCTVWTSGLFWANDDGVQTLVELRDQSKTMVVAIRCRQDNITKCLQLRSQVIQKVLAALLEFCPRLNTSESFIDPSEVTHYPLRPTSQLTLFPLTAIAKSVVAGKSSVVSMTVKSLSLEALLLLEPYADLGEPILRKLFASEMETEVVKQGVLLDMASRFLKRIPKENRCDLILEIFEMDPLRLEDQMSEAGVRGPGYEIVRVLLHWRDGCEGTYQCLRGKLDQFSAFTGRNPLQLAEEL